MIEGVYRTRAYKLKPNAEQRKALEETLYLCCQLYNYLNQECINRIRFGQPVPSFYEMEHIITELKGVAPELYDVYSRCLIDVASRIDKAYKRVMKDRWDHFGTDDVDVREHHGRYGFPRFRTLNRYDSFTYSLEGFRFVDGKFHLSSIGDIKFCNKKMIKGEMRTCTVKRNAKGDWYVSITYVSEVIGKGEMLLDKVYHPVGIDLGLSNIATLSDGNVYPNSRRYERLLKGLSKDQRRMSVITDILDERASSDPNDEVQRLRIHYSDYPRERLLVELKKLKFRFDCRWIRFINVRKGEYLNFIRWLTAEYGAIALEDINILRLISKQTKKGMRRSFTGAAWGLFIDMMIQKAEWAGVPIRFVDPYNTSRTCSHCGNVKPNMALNHRTYYCIECGHVCDRDVNAALNILNGSGLRTVHSCEETEAHSQ